MLKAITSGALVWTLGLFVCVSAYGQSDSEFRTRLQLGTAQPGGSYFGLGTEYSSIFEQAITDLQVSAVETGGSVENLVRIGRGELQLGLAQATTATAVFKGEGQFEGADVSNVGLLGCLEPYALHIITRQGTGIESVADAAGRRVAIGAPGSANQLASRALLSAYGLSDADYTAMAEGSDDARAKLQDRNVDLLIDMQTVPYPGLQQVQASVRDVRLLPIEEVPLNKLVADTDFAEYAIAAEAYDFLDESLPTISDWSCMFASITQVSPELGREITRSIYENADKLTLPTKGNINRDNALLARGDLPLHPGAEAYFAER